MKRLLIPFLLSVIACRGPQKEAPAADSTALGAVAADQPAPSHLSFDELEGYSIDARTSLSDSLNFILLNSAEDLKQKFTASGTAPAPDFLINYVVGIAAKDPGNGMISTDSVRVNGSSIEIFVRTDHAPSATSASPSRLIVIEKRTDVISIRFFVNGIPTGEIIL